MVAMSMFEAATILMEISNFKGNPNRKRKNAEAETKIIIPKRSRSHKVKEMKSTTNVADIIPKAPRKQKVKEMKMTVMPEMPTAMRDRIVEMGGYEMELVIQKQLHDTDLNKNHGRLSLPIKKLRFDFATEEEAEILNQHVDKKNKRGINVTIIDPFLRESEICLKKWKIGSGDVYCLMTHWNSFVQHNCLKSGEVVQLWSFRKNETKNNPHELCFAIAKPHVSEFM